MRDKRRRTGPTANDYRRGAKCLALFECVTGPSRPLLWLRLHPAARNIPIDWPCGVGGHRGLAIASKPLAGRILVLSVAGSSELAITEHHRNRISAQVACTAKRSDAVVVILDLDDVATVDRGIGPALGVDLALLGDSEVKACSLPLARRHARQVLLSEGQVVGVRLTATATPGSRALVIATAYGGATSDTSLCD